MTMALRFLRENPFGLILAGLAVGAIVGAVVPVSDVERDNLGPLRDEVAKLAKRAAADVVEHGRGVFEETLSAASASVAKHGQALAGDLQHEFRAG
jgi:hypothetical protein